MQIYPSGVCIFLAGIWKKQQQQQNKLTNHWDSRGEVREKEEGERKGKGEERREERGEDCVSVCMWMMFPHFPGIKPPFPRTAGPAQPVQSTPRPCQEDDTEREVRWVCGRTPWSQDHALDTPCCHSRSWQVDIPYFDQKKSLNPSGSGNPCSYVFPLFPQLF